MITNQTYYAECYISGPVGTGRTVAYTVNAPNAEAARAKALDYSGGKIVEFSPWSDLSDEDADLVA